MGDAVWGDGRRITTNSARRGRRPSPLVATVFLWRIEERRVINPSFILNLSKTILCILFFILTHDFTILCQVFF